MSARAMVLVGPHGWRWTSSHFHDRREDALLRIEACGCAVATLSSTTERLPDRHSVLIHHGHEPVGTIEKIGAEASRLERVGRGRVAVEPLLGCGYCAHVDGNYRTC